MKLKEPNLLERLSAVEFSAEQVCQAVGISRRQLIYWVDRGYITAVSADGDRRRYTMESIRQAYLYAKVGQGHRRLQDMHTVVAAYLKSNPFRLDGPTATPVTAPNATPQEKRTPVSTLIRRAAQLSDDVAAFYTALRRELA
jgi:DNA-binding transcriptional MerR regulator